MDGDAQEPSGSLAVRGGTGRSPLALLTGAPTGWAYDRVDLPSDDELLVRFSATRSRDWVEVRVVPLGAPGPVFRRLAHCQVRYRASVAQTGPEGREVVANLVLGIALAVDARLSAFPRATIAEVMGRRADRQGIVFTPEGVRELLVPWIVEGIPVAGGWSLADVYPASRTMLRGDIDRSLVLDFTHATSDERAIFCISPHLPDPPGFARSAHLQLDHVTMGRPSSPSIETLRAFVAFVVQLNDHPRLSITFPEDAIVIAPGDGIDLAREDEVLNLAISSECGQQCAFCSVKSTAPAFDGGDETFAAVSNDLAREARRGVRTFRLNGYDPLSYSRVVDVAKLASALGYQRVQIFSPATRLSDRAFAEKLFAALPPHREIFVPIYGVTAAVHDAVVGRPGAFDEVQRALVNLHEMGEVRVSLLSVITSKNHHELHALWAFANERRVTLSAHFPYPSFESRADRYFESAPRQHEVASALFAERARTTGPKCSAREAQQLLEGVAPCVIHRAASAHGVRLIEWLPHDEIAPPIPGTEYRDSRYRQRAGDAFSAATVPCPHAERCAMRTICPGVLLRAYVELHGDEEFQPVTLREILAPS
ncbi:radical SAM protein [Sandaracinus amylolyticus]|uniref:radical SAM protein n=1 Tax=Sandaracinus amylolyticus TaxID=927083 RepID=UPI001F2E1F89|nr:radical SAM protein [Sandaracinus amylolyticus]UJR84361.1 Hypothetical protein I5071_64400 [Sandaracinus amylolyticus]